MSYIVKIFQNKKNKQLIVNLSKKKLECMIKKNKLEAKIPEFIRITKKNLIFKKNGSR